jgi:hypothetical protein
VIFEIDLFVLTANRKALPDIMNYVFLSPHFPPNYYLFCIRLRELGGVALGVADESYDNLRPELRQALNDYYKVSDMHDYDALVRGLGYFTSRYGKLDKLDSFNEYWLQTEAGLRNDFNLDGLRPADMPAMKQKSLMKAVFHKCGIETAAGIVVQDAAQARAFALEAGFPLVAKPDIGVGAHGTWRISDTAQLDSFLADERSTGYFLEKFIRGSIETFDGLTNNRGEIVFCSSLEYSQGIMETVNADNDVYYYTRRVIPADLRAAGTALVREYGLRGRFFHFEFFRTPENKLLGLEVNMRLPGGLTPDMWNFSNDFDIYQQWARIAMDQPFSAKCEYPYHCAYIGRKNRIGYAHKHDEVVAALGKALVHHQEISGVFASALGDYGYLVRSPDISQIHDMARLIHRHAGV